MFSVELSHLRYMLQLTMKCILFLVSNCQSPNIVTTEIIIIFFFFEESQESKRGKRNVEVDRYNFVSDERPDFFYQLARDFDLIPNRMDQTVTSPCKHGRGEANKSDLIGPRSSVFFFIGVTLRFDRESPIGRVAASLFFRVTEMRAVVSCGKGSLSREERERKSREKRTLSPSCCQERRGRVRQETAVDADLPPHRSSHDINDISWKLRNYEYICILSQKQTTLSFFYS